MLGLPRTTEFNTRIPKQKFYENLSVTPAMKRIFVEQIKAVYWRNKIATTTMNLAAGERVTEIEIFEVKLNNVPLDEAILRQMDKGIPYHILFLLEYEGKYQAWTAYKEISAAGTKVFKTGPYYHTDWLAEDALPLRLDGLSVDAVYENFVRQIAGGALGTQTAEETLTESVARDAQRRALEKQIAVMQAKVHKEKQLNKQVVLNAELKALRKALEAL